MHKTVKEAELKRARIQEFYAHFDAFQCQGLCHQLCSKAHFTPVEWELLSDKRSDTRRPARESERLLKKRQDELNWLGGKTDRNDDCEYLSPIKTCEIYEERPWVCRAFGAVADASMVCKFGCKPIMTKAEFRRLIHTYADVLIEKDFLVTTSVLRLPVPNKYI